MEAVIEETQYSNPTDATTSPEEDKTPVASIRERVAAQVLDLVACSVIAWIAAMFLNRRAGGLGALVHEMKAGEISVWLPVAAIVGCGLLYFFLQEWAAAASIGKLICRLEVKTLAYARCDVVSALVRTAFRPVDVLVGPIFMWFSRCTQRLGDRVAGTLVLRRASEPPNSVGQERPRATWEERTRAAIVDLALLSMFVFAYLFATGSLVENGRLHFRAGALLLIPLLQLLFSYFVVLEGSFGGTVGKLVCGLQIVPVARSTSSFAAATLRMLVYPLNLLSFGLLPLVLLRVTQRQQHLGDLLASTVVVRSASEGRARIWVTAAALSAIALLAIYPLACQATTRLLAAE